MANCLPIIIFAAKARVGMARAILEKPMVLLAIIIPPEKSSYRDKQLTVWQRKLTHVVMFKCFS